MLSGRAAPHPKLGTGIVEAIRAPQTTRAAAVKARTAAMNELRSLLLTAPQRCATGCADSARSRWCEPARRYALPATPPTPRSQCAPLCALAHRHHALTGEIPDLDAQLRRLVEWDCPALIAIHGVDHHLSKTGEGRVGFTLRRLARSLLTTGAHLRKGT